MYYTSYTEKNETYMADLKKAFKENFVSEEIIDNFFLKFDKTRAVFLRSIRNRAESLEMFGGVLNQVDYFKGKFEAISTISQLVLEFNQDYLREEKLTKSTASREIMDETNQNHDESNHNISTELIHAFFNSLKNAKINKINETEILEFEIPAKFAPLYIDKLGLKSLMIRKCYVDLYDLILSQKLDTILIGNPGIGKSFFGIYLMYKLIEADQTFLYEPVGCNNLVFLYNGKQAIKKGYNSPSTLSTSPRKSRIEVLQASSLGLIYASDESIIHIVDGHCPEISPFRIVLTCSPRFTYYEDICKKCANSVYYVPVWSKSEIEECRKIVYRDLHADIVDDLFKKWGGVPRFVLRIPLELLKKSPINPNDKEQAIKEMIVQKLDESLNLAIKACTLENIFSFDGNLQNQGDRSNRVMHIVVKDGSYYQKYAISFASEYVAKRVLDSVAANDKKKLFIEMMNFYRNDKEDRQKKISRIDKILERFCHDLIIKGEIEVTTRNLGRGIKTEKDEKLETQSEIFNMPNCIRVEKMISSASELNLVLKSEEFFSDKKPNCAVYFINTESHSTSDSISIIFKEFKPDKVIFYNATSGAKHDAIINDFFMEYIELEIFKDVQFDFIYVVIEDYFEKFRYRKEIKCDNDKWEKQSSRICFKVLKITYDMMDQFINWKL